MNKTFIISVLLLTLILSVPVIMIMRSSGDTEPGNVGQPIVGNSTSGTGSTNSTGEVPTRSFLQNASVTTDEYNDGYYFLGNTFTDQASGDGVYYVVTYQADTDYFNVTLLKKPYGVARFEAESYLSDLLQVDAAELCDLKYTVSVPGYIDEFASGVDYRFSNCSDSVNTPTS